MSQSGSPTGARLLLKRLRNIMAQPGTPQARLDQIVRIIAGDMVAATRAYSNFHGELANVNPCI